ncbi:hypothetical protein BDA96_01G219600 [Sorghum bicolor]|uniref:Dof zinc finger protein n=1 Tax=Sorghum bicolor TaxID=4558 RepID=A0A921S0I6_SORBI|nr:hypothetical protein BDA96_01G219600 [Sorghum bicolor]KAG0549031.1 hypothetical protein BDA96_01G219600 [Sorghum bicolor]
MPSSFLTSPSSSASSHLSYLIPASARPPPPLAMGQGYGGATGGISVVPTGGVVATTNALNAAAAAPPPPRQGSASRNAGGAGHPPLPRPPPRQCPRCQSANTKFCYYNNYSREQPRYLCKACRRHWTEGGTLRDVPVGGGRKNRRGAKGGSAKASASAAAAATNVLGVGGADTFPDFLRQQLLQFQPGAAVGGGGYAIDLGAWQQMSAATAPPPPPGTGGDVSTLGAAGTAAAEAEANCAALQYWSEWQQDGMPGLDGAC